MNKTLIKCNLLCILCLITNYFFLEEIGAKFFSILGVAVSIYAMKLSGFKLNLNKKRDVTSSKPRRKRNIIMPIISLIIRLLPLLLVMTLIIGSISMNYVNEQTYTITVTDTTVKRGGDYDKYLIFAKTNLGEDIVFENTDLFFKGKFNSSDIQAKLKVNKKYKITTLGYRIPFFSSYQNIIAAEELG